MYIIITQLQNQLTIRCQVQQYYTVYDTRYLIYV